VDYCEKTVLNIAGEKSLDDEAVVQPRDRLLCRVCTEDLEQLTMEDSYGTFKLYSYILP
jgi:hypothetical protein